jgi:hypothetical protein
MGKLLALLLFAGSAHASSNLVSGNGYGYVSVDPQSGALTRFWAHPYIYRGAA